MMAFIDRARRGLHIARTTNPPNLSRRLAAATEELLDEIERETRRLGSAAERAHALVSALRRRVDGDATATESSSRTR
jgi:hypothetical protein